MTVSVSSSAILPSGHRSDDAPVASSSSSSSSSPTSTSIDVTADKLTMASAAATSPSPSPLPSTSDPPPRFQWSELLRFMGPGWLMSIAYLDPGNIESDLQAGACTGFQLLWVLLVSTALGWFIQVLACRLGVVTGKHLAQICRREYPRHISLSLWVLIELAIIASDIQEVLGSALAFHILFGLPLWAGALITTLDTFTFLLLHVWGVRKLEAFFAALITTMLVMFCVDLGYAAPSAVDVASGFAPIIRSYAVMQAVGIFGSVIMPHNMYLHSALVQSRPIERHVHAQVRDASFYLSFEAAIALGVSFLINLAVVAVFAQSFFDPTCANQGQALVNGVCQDVGLTDAADTLEGALGFSAKVVFAIGLLASGQSSTMTGTYTGQFVMTGFLNLHVKQWQRVALTRAIAVVPALFVGLVASNRSDLLDMVNQWINVFMSIQLPFALLPLLKFTSDTRLMGRYANSVTMNALGWTIALLVMAVNYFTVAQTLVQQADTLPTAALVVIVLVAAGYSAFVAYLAYDDVKRFARFVSRVVFCGGGGDGDGDGDGDQGEPNDIEVDRPRLERLREDELEHERERERAAAAAAAGADGDGVGDSDVVVNAEDAGVVEPSVHATAYARMVDSAAARDRSASRAGERVTVAAGVVNAVEPV